MTTFDLRDLNFDKHLADAIIQQVLIDPDITIIVNTNDWKDWINTLPFIFNVIDDTKKNDRR